MRWLGFLAAGCALALSFGCDDTFEMPAPPTSRVIRVQDWGYVQGKYFFLINPNDPNAVVGTLTRVHVYLDDKDARNNVELGAQKARVWLDPNETGFTPATGMFHVLGEEQDYTVPFESNLGFPRIELKSALSPYQTLAVAFIQTVGSVSETVGTWVTTVDTSTVLDLKMLRPSEEEWGSNDLNQSPWKDARYLEAKNVYTLGVRDIEPGSLTVDIVRDITGPSGQNPNYIQNEFYKRTPLLQVLGLDQKNNANTTDRTPDQRIDPEYVDLENGYIFFPDLRPFDPDLADIEGVPGGRDRSWPRADGVDRPDTLGWYKDQVTGEPIPSSAQIREQDLVPEIYDWLFRELARTSIEHHRYTIVAHIALN